MADRQLFELTCDVAATRFHETPNPRAWHIFLAEFHWAVLEIHVDWGEQDGNLKAGFRELFVHLEQLLGKPTFCYPDDERGLPSVFWERPRLTIGYSLLGGRPRLKIAHEPDGYDELKREARIIREREGEGARVEYRNFHW